MNSFLKFFLITNYKEYGHPILIKMNDVLKSCETESQYKMAVKFARIAFYNIRSFIKRNDSSLSIKSHFYLMRIIRDIETDFLNKSVELNVKYSDIF